MIQAQSRVLRNEEVAEGYYRLTIDTPEIAERARPGQFIMIRTGKSHDPLLRRPFSIHRINISPKDRMGAWIQILYKIIGRGTGMMSHIKDGEMIEIFGPLGNGFSCDNEVAHALIVGGGIGIAPMMSLADNLRAEGKTVTVFMGGRTSGDILCVQDFEALGARILISTDDGSSGKHGFVTQMLDDYLRTSRLESETSTVFSCGPLIMSKKIAHIAKTYDIPCQVSLEAHMACGVGACLGCIVKIRDKQGLTPLPVQETSGCTCDAETVSGTILPESAYGRVCVEGPVFHAEDVQWD